ncbi:nicotinate-nucleotide adenylyltransferase [Algibacter sp. R77976]|uniref:nicotinate-nucleotide adenylyltransferase n=1 Tax=Algibacter sp. R77976 TaxID=3093873 RepID=UPI0037C76A6B
MKKLVLGLFIFGLTIQVNAQTVELSETIISINSEYMHSIDSENTCTYVKKLEQALLEYNPSNLSDLYDSKNDIYNVTFQIPEGRIVASFNKDGKIVKTHEKYNNIRLPEAVIASISEKYPKSNIIEDVYVIKFHCDEDAREQVYKVTLKNDGENIITVRTNNKGEFI